MKRIAYRRPDGGLSIVIPVEGGRLARSVTIDGETMKAAPPVPVSLMCGNWPKVGATAEWAETEDEFATRIAEKDVPAGALDVAIIEADSLPADRTFRDAWALSGGTVGHDMAKAREIAHAMRRAQRAEEMAPHDRVVALAIPGTDVAGAEAARAALRTKYAEKQDAIDAAQDVDALKSALSE